MLRVELSFPLVELALPTLHLLAGLIQFLLSRAARRGLKVEGVDFRLLFGAGDFQLHLERGDRLLAFA